MRAQDAIRKQPVTTSPEVSIADVARRMNEEVVGSVVVVDRDDHPIGIVTDRDLVIRALARDVPPDARVDAVMSTELVTIDADADARQAFRLFESHACRRLPVLRDGVLVGVVSADDLLIDVIGDLGQLARPITGQVVFGYPEQPAAVARA